jgi:hypothetical protein
MASAQYLDFGIPFPPYPSSSSGSFNTFSFGVSNFTTKKIACTFMPEEAHVITALGCGIASRTGTPPTYRISLQAVDGSGNPDGTVLGGGSPASVTFTPPADASWNNTFQWFNLSNNFTVTRGTIYAVVVDYSSGTADASNFSVFNTGHNNIGARAGFPVAQHFDGSSWAKQLIAPVYGYRTASRSYGFPVGTFFTTVFSSDTAGTEGDERGMRFNLPAGWGASYKVRGVRWIGNMSATGKSIDVNLYSGVAASTSSIQSTTGIDSDFAQGTGNYCMFTIMFDEATLATLDFGTDYWIGIKPNEPASNLGIFGIAVDSAQDRECFGLGSNSIWAWRTDAGTWDVTKTTRCPMMWLILDDITEPAAGGGGGGKGMMVFH